MKYTPLIAPFLVIAIILLNQTFAHDKKSVKQTAPASSAPSQQLADSCYQHWLTLNWTLTDSKILASQNTSFNDGVKRVCQARAELFFEGYEIHPFISPDSQPEVFRLVFRANVDEIKSQIRINLPKLRLI